MRTIISLFAVMVFAFIGFSIWGAGRTGFSTGQRSGVLVKLSYKGVVHKSWEGELKLQEGGSSLEDTGRWQFSVPDERVARELGENMGKSVTLSYDQCYSVNPLRYDTPYYVHSWKQETK